MKSRDVLGCLSLKHETFARIDELGDGELRYAFLERAIRVHELEQLEHFSRISNTLCDGLRHLYARVDRSKFAVEEENRALAHIRQKI